jgi:hypothetical protein
MTAGPAPLWSGRSRTLVVGLSGVGVALMTIGWARVSDESNVNTQIAWLNVAVSGLLVAGLGNAMWLLRGHRSVTRLRSALLPPTFGAAAIGRDDDAVSFERRELVAAAGMTRYHRADCLLAAGKPVGVADRAVHEADGRRPCQTCRP